MSEDRICPVCHGKKSVMKTSTFKMNGNSIPITESIICNRCHGHGTLPSSDDDD
jgi:DnaJ-class molecular chaperone